MRESCRRHINKVDSRKRQLRVSAKKDINQSQQPAPPIDGKLSIRTAVTRGNGMAYSRSYRHMRDAADV